MTDYVKPTGSSGSMMLRDLGSVVEFWIEASSSTFAHEMPWRYYVNGSWSSYRDFDFAGGAYRKLGQVTVTTSQVVGFSIGDTGTSGLGGPTTLTIAIDRATVPPRPTIASLLPTGPTTGSINVNLNGTGGATVLQIQAGWAGVNASSPTSFKDLSLSDGTGTITGLTKGTQYRFWARARNSEGWGAWAPSKTLTTWTEPPAPTTPVMSLITQNSLRAQFVNNGFGGTAIIEWQLSYGTNAEADQATIVSTGTSDLTNLNAGYQYFIKARGRNSVGWGAWSAIGTATLKAGANVKIGDTWYRAVPYVRTGGVWKIAQPYVKIAGLWKETS